ncbi:MAG: DNA repair protein RecO [bacterium]
MAIYETFGFVLQSKNFGETDKIVTFFTEDFGKISAIAKGIRKSKKRYGPGLDLLSYDKIFLYGKEHTTLYTLSQWEIKNSFYETINNDMNNKFIYLSYLAEFIKELTAEKQKNNNLFNLILNIFEKIKKVDAIENIIGFFELHALSILGYCPKIDKCVKCNSLESTQQIFFNIKCGGILCNKCSLLYSDSYMVKLTTIKMMKMFLNFDLEKLLCMKFNKIFFDEYRKILNYFIKYYFDKELHSLKFMVYL